MTDIATKPEVTEEEPLPVITAKEWRELCRSLEIHHAIFYKLFEVGRPVFTKSISTAAVTFDKEGGFIAFLFNPKFWNSLNWYTRKFIICHEQLHILLNHGVRGLDLDPDCANVAMDITVNHMLVDKFGFNRQLIQNERQLCWIDTVFTNEWMSKKDAGFLRTDRCFEFYYNLLDKENRRRLEASGEGSSGAQGLPLPSSVDDHSRLPMPEEVDQDVHEAADKISPDEAGDFKDAVGDEGPESDTAADARFKQTGGTGRGTAPGQWFMRDFQVKVTRKRKWETVIKRWSMKYTRPDEFDVEQWARTNRRLSGLAAGDLMLPSEVEDSHMAREENRVVVDFYLDTSGSCFHLKERFFNAAASLPLDRFEVNLFCFDTMVYPTSLESNEVYGGGGTSFDIIEADIQNRRRMCGESAKYPDAVFLISDGLGNAVFPEKPESWYWFLTAMGASNTRYVSAKSNKFNLQDYE